MVSDTPVIIHPTSSTSLPKQCAVIGNDWAVDLSKSIERRKVELNFILLARRTAQKIS